MHDDAAATSLTNLTLQETIARYEAILASTLDPIVIINSRGVIQSASDSIERVFGYAPDELIGQNVSVLMPEPHRSMHDTYLARYRETGETNILGRAREFHAVRKDGTQFPIELSVSRVDTPGQREPLFTGIIHDLSERQQAEEGSLLIQRLAIGISSARDLNAALVITLREICDTTGWDYGEAWLPTRDGAALTDGPFWHQPNRDLSAFRKATVGRQLKPGEGLPGRVLQSKRPEWLTHLDAPERGTFLRSDAARKAGLKAGFAVPILAEQQVIAVIAFYAHEQRSEDARLLELVAAATAPIGPVIQRRRAEEALIESERRFREMLNNVQVVAVMLDRDGIVTFCDDYLLQLTGCQRREDVVGRNWFDLFIPEAERDTVFTLFREGLARAAIEPYFENHILTSSGEKRLIAWSNTIMHGPGGEVVGATALGVDITDKRRIEAELERHRHHLEQLVAERTADLETTHEQLRMADRLASIGTLTAGLGHDMNNMLLPMRCRLDTIEQMDLSDSLREQIASLRNSVDYLQQLTDGLQLFALDPEDEEASAENTDINAWWSQVGPLLSRVVSKSTEFMESIPTNLPPVAVPSHRLTQAVLNLIVNAGEAVEHSGRVQFRVSAADDGRFVRLRVIDNGCGMTDQVKQRVLEPFFTTKKRGLGTGLGLSLVRGVVQHAGGSIKIDSEPGRGTVVSLLIPTAQDRRSGIPATDATCQIAACVSIADARMASFIVVLLQGAGVAVELTNDKGPPQCDIWFAQDDEDLLPAMQAYLEQPHRKIILYRQAGEKRAEERALASLPTSSVVLIDQPDNFESIRRVISDVIDQTMIAKESTEAVT